MTPGSLFEQTIMGSSPRCYIPNFVEIDPPVPENKFLKCFYHIWACFMIGQAVSEKKMFEHGGRRTDA